LEVVIPVAQFQLEKSPISKSILDGQPCVKALYDSTNNDKERKRLSFFINGVRDRWLGVACEPTKYKFLSDRLNI
jgi:hypothetical protein